MPEHHPAEQPGHLDIDAVSSYVDRDFGPDDLTTIELHLHTCPSCHREVLEIRTTVVLLAALPQYAPRRSFCLGHEFARRGQRGPRGASWSGGAPGWLAGGGAPAAAGARRYGAWLPGLQTVAVAVGAMLLMVTMTDMPGGPTAQLQQLAAPTALATSAAGAGEDGADRDAAGQGNPAAKSAADSDAEAPLAAAEPSAFQGAAPPASSGTSGAERASQEVAGDELSAPAAIAASSVVAALTPAAGGAQTEEAVPPAEVNAATTDEPRPSQRAVVQLVLALILGWLVVTIVGLRRVRALS